ncbi:hypothetical protein [Pseudodesulfovibrio pelocollis]|uniref:hypothetical protein n=1 Tax=Pseudodesulfovibrio pelocollis TaxID=3051432 RepID=UPI00255B3523|nr:hypothetical protein [Pseudodesulfovibrio sp. SB368]
MTLSLALLGLGLVAFAMLRRLFSLRRDAELASLENRLGTVRDRFESILARKRDLARELDDKERELATRRSNGEGIQTLPMFDLGTETIDENERVSRYLVSKGKITLEQSQKAFDKMGTLQMDYLAVCLTLGFIDLDTAKAVARAGKPAR